MHAPTETWQVSTKEIFEKDFLKIAFILTFLAISSLSRSQNNTLILTSYAHENSIYLRWAPNNIQLFELALQNGYTLEKINLNDNSTLTVSQFETLPKQTIIFKPVKSKLDSLKKTKSPLLKDYLLVEPFVSPKADVKAKKMAFAYCLINAGYNKTLAENLTLIYRETVKAKIAYRISITGTPNKSDVIIADANQNSRNKSISLEPGIAYKRSAMLTWEAETLETDFSAYYLERSDDAINFKKITALPIVFLSSQYEKNKTHCTYVDTTVEHGKRYHYRIKGVNHFALETSLSNIQEVYIKNKFTPFVEIDTVKCVGVKKLIYPKLVFANETEKKCCASLILMISKSPVKNFNRVLESKLFGFNGFSFNDSLARNYVHYKIGAISIDNDTVFSLPYYFFFNDSIPPVIPSEIAGAIDKNGIVSIQWKKNKETDLKGYKLFYANNLNEEFVEKTKDFCKPNAFTDTISLNNLDSVIYYKIVAVDSNFNHSKPSTPLRLVKPDKIAPVPPVFILVNSTQKGLFIKWNNSTSTDLKSTSLLRIENTKETLIKEFKKIDTTSFYYDSLVKPQINYQYKLIATDKSGNIAFSKSNYQIFEPGYRNAVANFTATPNIEKKLIALSWAAPNDPVFSYRIYRSKNNEPPILLKTLKSEMVFYNDKDLNQNNIYSYTLEAIFMSGVHSKMSLAVKVNY